ncbi:MAG: GntR family transcriptional regulator [Pirellulales bacterium]|nr:GntR family transcriptional regulator [Pirellulales bacterium]
MDTMTNKAYEHVRGRLLRGEFLPGARLGYASLCKEIGVSATPVREAVGKLASDGLVELLPKRGAIVRRLHRNEMIDTYQIREVLEAYAARRSAERITQAQLRQLRELVQTTRDLAHQFRDGGERQMSAEMIHEFNAADLEFHMIIIESTRNRQLCKIVGDCHVVIRIFECGRWESFDIPLVVSAYSFHRRIYRALSNRDGDRAEQLMGEHIRHGLEMAIAAMDKDKSPEWWRAP